MFAIVALETTMKKGSMHNSSSFGFPEVHHSLIALRKIVNNKINLSRLD